MTSQVLSWRLNIRRKFIIIKTNSILCFVLLGNVPQNHSLTSGKWPYTTTGRNLPTYFPKLEHWLSNNFAMSCLTWFACCDEWRGLEVLEPNILRKNNHKLSRIIMKQIIRMRQSLGDEFEQVNLVFYNQEVDCDVMSWLPDLLCGCYCSERLWIANMKL